MSKARRKFYVVWQGYSPGIYDSWTECQQQTVNYPGAKFKSFDSLEEATAAYRGNPEGQLDLVRAIASALPGMEAFTGRLSRPKSGIAVDGACAGNPGVMEYRGVDIASGRELFRIGSAGNLIGTNNIAEYLAIVHVAALLKKPATPPRQSTATPAPPRAGCAKAPPAQPWNTLRPQQLQKRLSTVPTCGCTTTE